MTNQHHYPTISSIMYNSSYGIKLATRNSYIYMYLYNSDTFAQAQPKSPLR